jgi:hypothetical protein
VLCASLTLPQSTQLNSKVKQQQEQQQKQQQLAVANQRISLVGNTQAQSSCSARCNRRDNGTREYNQHTTTTTTM